MSIFYLDYVNGNDANGGTSWADAWRTISSGATAARIGPNDTIRIAKSPDPVSIGTATWSSPAWRGGGTAGQVSITSSANTTPIQITKTGHGLVTGDVVFITGHSTNINANGTWKVTYISSSVFSLDNSTSSGSAGSGGTFEKINPEIVILDSAQTLTIDNCNWSAWTLANTATVTLQTGYTTCKEGNYSMQISKTSPANSTLYAYKTITSTNFAGYQRISFWLKNTSAVTVNQWKICLCSDTAGAVVVDEFLIPAISTTGSFLPLTVGKNGGGNMGAAIQSIALYSGSAAATNTLTVDNFIACTTSGMNLSSLISKNSAAQGGTELWYSIQSINNTIVVLESAIGGGYSTSGRGYYGATENIATYIRETIKTDLVSGTTASQEIKDSGTAGSLIAFEGGYNTSSSVQDGETFFDGQNFGGYGIYSTSKNYYSLNYINCNRYNVGFYLYSGSGVALGSVRANANTTPGMDLESITIASATNILLNNNGSNGLKSSSSVLNATNLVCVGNGSGIGAWLETGDVIGTLKSCNNSGYGIQITGTVTITTISKVSYNGSSGLYMNVAIGSSIGTITEANYNSSSGIEIYGGYGNSFGTVTDCSYNQYGLYFESGTKHNTFNLITSISNNTSYGIQYSTSSNNIIEAITNCNNNGNNAIYCLDSTDNRINSISTTGNGGSQTLYMYSTNGANYVFYLRNALLNETTKFSVGPTGANLKVKVWKYTQTADTHYIATDNGSIQSTQAGGKRHTASGIAWQFSPTALRLSYYPLTEKLAEIAVIANKLVTVQCWVLKDHATNIGASIFCRGKQLAGVPSDIEITKANDTNYEQLTMTFTPTEAGVITIDMKAWYIAGASNAYFDDLSVTQAT